LTVAHDAFELVGKSIHGVGHLNQRDTTSDLAEAGATTEPEHDPVAIPDRRCAAIPERRCAAIHRVARGAHRKHTLRHLDGQRDGRVGGAVLDVGRLARGASRRAQPRVRRDQSARREIEHLLLGCGVEPGRDEAFGMMRVCPGLTGNPSRPAKARSFSATHKALGFSRKTEVIDSTQYRTWRLSCAATANQTAWAGLTSHRVLQQDALSPLASVLPLTGVARRCP